MAAVNISIDKEWIEKAAKGRGLTVSAYIRELVKSDLFEQQKHKTFKDDKSISLRRRMCLDYNSKRAQLGAMLATKETRGRTYALSFAGGLVMGSDNTIKPRGIFKTKEECLQAATQIIETITGEPVDQELTLDLIGYVNDVGSCGIILLQQQTDKGDYILHTSIPNGAKAEHVENLEKEIERLRAEIF